MSEARRDFWVGCPECREVYFHVTQRHRGGGVYENNAEPLHGHNDTRACPTCYWMLVRMTDGSWDVEAGQ